MTIDSFQRNPRLPHDLPHQCRSILKCFFIIIPGLHAHFHTDAVPVAIRAEQVAVSVVYAHVPASAAVRRRLVCCISVINVIVGRHIGQLTIMLRFCMCLGICTCSEIIRIVYHDTPWIVFGVGVLIADIGSVNFHFYFLSPADLRRRKKRTAVSALTLFFVSA